MGSGCGLCLGFCEWGWVVGRSVFDVREKKDGSSERGVHNPKNHDARGWVPIQAKRMGSNEHHDF